MSASSNPKTNDESSTSSNISKTNQIINLETFNNNFYICRHGNSEANVLKIISSSPETATVKHGLSPLGNEQASSASTKFVDEKCGDRVGDGATAESPFCDNVASIVLVTSDYLRAFETAKHFASTLQTNKLPVEATTNFEEETNYHPFITTSKSLRERSFGDFEGLEDHVNYNKVWTFDKDDANHTNNNVESVNSVILRTTTLLKELDDTYRKRKIILFAHGDVLQILQTAVLKVDGRSHRSLEHLDTAVVRELILGDYKGEKPTNYQK